MVKYSLDTLSVKRYASLKRTAKLSNQLCALLCPDELRVILKTHPVPKDVEELKANLCWGQRLLMATPHTLDLETIYYYTANYFAPFHFSKYNSEHPYSDHMASKMYIKLLSSHARDVFPVTNRLVNLFKELIEQENERLKSKPNKTMIAAGVDKLNVFSDWSALELIAEKCRITDIERNALTVSYNTAITILLKEKEVAEFQERFTQIVKIQNESKHMKK